VQEEARHITLRLPIKSLLDVDVKTGDIGVPEDFRHRRRGDRVLKASVSDTLSVHMLTAMMPANQF